MSTATPETQLATQIQMPMQLEITRLIHHALAEDLGVSPGTVARMAGGRELADFDITTVATVEPDARAFGEFVVKRAGVIAGLPFIQRVFETIDPSIEFEILVDEGFVAVEIPTVIARVRGSARAILVAERTALNILQRLCGVATATREYSKKAEPLGICILDTRKTTPGMRLLEKYAVRVAGGTNHRVGLYDAILIKDNHIRIAGGITSAIEKSRAKFPSRPLEIEVTNQSELQEALSLKAEKVLLDNMTPAQVAESVKLVNGQAFIEVSGGVNLSNIETYLLPGVNAISIGAITHTVRSLDISLEIGG